jgi:ABC-2 type transport system ATP-binding protein
MGELAIESRGLSRKHGRLIAVDHVDLQVPSGAIYGFIGPNGAGKSTTIRLLLGLLHPSAGSASTLGFPAGDSRALERIGSLVEQPALHPNLSGRDHLNVLRLYRGLPSMAVDRALQQVDLGTAADRLVRTYSLGMKQRLGIASAILHNPSLLILDEPSNGLDPAGIQEMRNLLKRLAQDGKTLFVSSHLLGEVEQVASHVGLLHRGKLGFQGPLAALRSLDRPGIALRVDPLEPALRLLRASGYEVRSGEDGTLQVTGVQNPADLNRALVGEGLRVSLLAPLEGSLEARFLELTEA